MGSSLTPRLENYKALSKQLELLSDQELTEIGSTLTLNDQTVFVKKIRLTDLERKAENYRSTANLFELPLYYQYGISSAGFGAWRELSAQLMTTEWVLKGECPNFPLLYHWRVLPCSAIHEPDEIERSVKYWGGSEVIRSRLEAKQKATAELVLFLEYIPDTLHQWFPKQNHSEAALAMIERELISVTSFMRSKNFLHFDAHFENILTDGNHLYFADCGLAISKQFQLSQEEINFFENHLNYDFCQVMSSLVHRILAIKNLSKEQDIILKRYASMAAILKDFHQKIIHEDKNTPYPHAELDYFLDPKRSDKSSA